jgi:hypothetical protein
MGGLGKVLPWLLLAGIAAVVVIAAEEESSGTN